MPKAKLSNASKLPESAGGVTMFYWTRPDSNNFDKATSCPTDEEAQDAESWNSDLLRDLTHAVGKFSPLNTHCRGRVLELYIHKRKA